MQIWHLTHYTYWSVSDCLPLPLGLRWLLYGAVALCLLALELIHLTTLRTGTTMHSQIGAAYRIGVAAVVLVLAITGVSFLPVALIGLVAVACAVQVVLELLGKS